MFAESKPEHFSGECALATPMRNFVSLMLWLCVFDVSAAVAADTKDARRASKPTPALPLEWRHEKRCGVNCLYVMLRMLGAPADYDQLCHETAIDDKGTSMAELVRVAKEHGISLTPIMGNHECWDSLDMPAIIHQLTDEPLAGHYVLLLHRQEQMYYVLDCTTGQMRPMNKGDFLARWSGYALVLQEPSNLLGELFLSWVFLGSGVAAVVLLMLWKRYRRRAPGGVEGSAPSVPIDSP